MQARAELMQQRGSLTVHLPLWQVLLFVLALAATVVRIEMTTNHLGTAIDKLSSVIEQLDERSNDHEGRIRVLEDRNRR